MLSGAVPICVGETLMDRRGFIASAASAGLSSLLATHGAQAQPLRPGKGELRVGVVGGGILGASIAMHCARAGAKVTLLEKVAPAAGATSKSMAWINPFVDDEHYMLLRLEGIKRWLMLDNPLGMDVTWGGYIGFTDKPADRGRMAVQSRHLAAAGHPTTALDMAALNRLAPDIHLANLVEATWSDLGGHVDPVHVTLRFLAAARAAGARIEYPCGVTAIEPGGGSSPVVKVQTTSGPMTFDHLVVVAGVDAPALLAPLGYRLPLQYSPGALVHSKPVPIITRKVYDGPGPLEWKQMANGSIVGLEASTPPHIPVHEAGILKHPMQFPPGIAEMHGTRILSKFAACVPAIANAGYDHMTLGFRPMPVDDLPVVGRVPEVPGVSLCVTHSGVTLAAVLGSYVADEVVAGRDAAMLAPYRPNRVFPASA